MLLACRDITIRIKKIIRGFRGKGQVKKREVGIFWSEKEEEESEL